MAKPKSLSPAQRKPKLQSSERSTKLDLSNFARFCAHSLVLSLKKQFAADSTLARAAVDVLVNDLETLNAEYQDHLGRVAFTTIEGRVKSEDSFFRKLYLSSREDGKTHGITQITLQELYLSIADLAGVRFSCPYYDEVRRHIDDLVRPGLSNLDTRPI